MVDSSTGVPLLRNDGGYGATPQVAGPKGRLGRFGRSPLTSLRSDGKKERGAWGSWSPGCLKTIGDLGFLSIHPTGVVRGGELSKHDVGVSLNRLRRMERKGRYWGLLKPRRSHD